MFDETTGARIGDATGPPAGAPAVARIGDAADGVGAADPPGAPGAPAAPGERAVPDALAGWDALASMLSLAGRLKATPRTGWLDRGVPPGETESVADHGFRVALLAWAVASMPGAPGEPGAPGAAGGQPLDPARVLLVALAHDLPEALAGDPTPYAPEDIPGADDPDARRAFLDRRQERDPDRAAAKRAAEAGAMSRLVADLPPALGEALHGAWREYEDQQTPAARLVKQADRLETWLQSREYLAADPDLPMASFQAQIDDPTTLPDARMRALRDAIARRFGPGSAG